jgi:hypothetical protein
LAGGEERQDEQQDRSLSNEGEHDQHDSHDARIFRGSSAGDESLAFSVRKQPFNDSATTEAGGGWLL